MENCKTCKHSVFDEIYGEYKCKKRERRIYILLDSSECNFYKKASKKKEESKTQADSDWVEEFLNRLEEIKENNQ